jgi:hypothetical protein
MTTGGFLLLVFATYGIYRILRFSKLRWIRILRVWYKRLYSIEARKNLFSCPLCLGTQIGFLTAVLWLLPPWILIPPAMGAAVFLIHFCVVTPVDEFLALFVE